MSIEAAAAEAEDRRVAALLAGDADAIAGLFDENVAYVHANGLQDTKESYLESVRGGQLVYRTIDISDRTATSHGATAVLVFRMRTEVLYRGEERSLDNICTTVWAGPEPRLISFQATPRTF